MKTTSKYKRGTPEHREFLRTIGAKGGVNNFLKHGEKHMAKIGRRGGERLLANLGGPEAAKQYFADIGAMGKGQGRVKKGVNANG